MDIHRVLTFAFIKVGAAFVQLMFALMEIFEKGKMKANGNGNGNGDQLERGLGTKGGKGDEDGMSEFEYVSKFREFLNALMLAADHPDVKVNTNTRTEHHDDLAYTLLVLGFSIVFTASALLATGFILVPVVRMIKRKSKHENKSESEKQQARSKYLNSIGLLSQPGSATQATSTGSGIENSQSVNGVLPCDLCDQFVHAAAVSFVCHSCKLGNASSENYSANSGGNEKGTLFSTGTSTAMHMPKGVSMSPRSLLSRPARSSASAMLETQAEKVNNEKGEEEVEEEEEEHDDDDYDDDVVVDDDERNHGKKLEEAIKKFGNLSPNINIVRQSDLGKKRNNSKLRTKEHVAPQRNDSYEADFEDEDEDEHEDDADIDADVLGKGSRSELQDSDDNESAEESAIGPEFFELPEIRSLFDAAIADQEKTTRKEKLEQRWQVAMSQIENMPSNFNDRIVMIDHVHVEEENGGNVKGGKQKEEEAGEERGGGRGGNDEKKDQERTLFIFDKRIFLTEGVKPNAHGNFNFHDANSTLRITNDILRVSSLDDVDDRAQDVTVQYFTGNEQERENEVVSLDEVENQMIAQNRTQLQNRIFEFSLFEERSGEKLKIRTKSPETLHELLIKHPDHLSSDLIQGSSLTAGGLLSRGKHTRNRSNLSTRTGTGTRNINTISGKENEGEGGGGGGRRRSTNGNYNGNYNYYPYRTRNEGEDGEEEEEEMNDDDDDDDDDDDGQDETLRRLVAKEYEYNLPSWHFCVVDCTDAEQQSENRDNPNDDVNLLLAALKEEGGFRGVICDLDAVESYETEDESGHDHELGSSLNQADNTTGNMNNLTPDEEEMLSQAIEDAANVIFLITKIPERGSRKRAGLLTTLREARKLEKNIVVVHPKHINLDSALDSDGDTHAGNMFSNALEVGNNLQKSFIVMERELTDELENFELVRRIAKASVDLGFLAPDDGEAY